MSRDCRARSKRLWLIFWFIRSSSYKILHCATYSLSRLRPTHFQDRDKNSSPNEGPTVPPTTSTDKEQPSQGQPTPIPSRLQYNYPVARNVDEEVCT